MYILAFVCSENYRCNISAWKGKWKNLGELIDGFAEVWTEIAGKKRVSVNILKNSVPCSIIGNIDIKNLSIYENHLYVNIGSKAYNSKLNFLSEQELYIKKNNKTFYVMDSEKNILYSYLNFQSKYNIEDRFSIYTYEAENFPFKYIALTDIDENTENTLSKSFHACFSNNLTDIMKSGNVHTFVSDDEYLPGLLKGLFI